MRGAGWIVVGGLALAGAGCAAARDAFSAHADQVAHAAGQTLSAQRLAELVAPAKRLPINQGTLSSVAYLWVDYVLFAAALAENARLDDSATVLAAAWPAVAQLKWEAFHARLVGDRVLLTDRQLDSVYEAGNMRLFQHILLRVPANSAADVERGRRAEIERLRREIRAANGANFARLARAHSDDPASKAAGGALGVAERDEPYVAEFKDAAWGLAPGEISDVVRSAYGFHLIRRPPLGEVRDAFRAGAQERLQQRFDSVYLDSLAVERGVEVRSDAPALARQALLDLGAAWENDRVLVTYRGGAFRVRDLVRWLHAIDPQYAQAVQNAGDGEIRAFLRVLTQRHLVIHQADSAGVAVPADAWRQIRAQHDSALRLLQSALRLSPELLADSAPPGARLRFAVARVDDYLARVLSNRAQFVPLPPFLGATLRARGRWAVIPAGVLQATSRAEALRAAVDSLAPAPAEDQRLIPAPGPAPIPGGGTP